MNKGEQSALTEMGVTKNVIAKIYDAPSKAEGERLFEEAKAICKKGFRSKARTLHPDINGGDEDKTRHFKILKEAKEGFIAGSYGNWRKRGASRYADEWDIKFPYNPMMANFMREEQRRTKQQAMEEEFARQVSRQKVGRPPSDHVPTRPRRTRPKAKAKVPFTYLASKNGIWFPQRGKWILKTERPNKNDK